MDRTLGIPTFRLTYGRLEILKNLAIRLAHYRPTPSLPAEELMVYHALMRAVDGRPPSIWTLLIGPRQLVEVRLRIAHVAAAFSMAADAAIPAKERARLADRQSGVDHGLVNRWAAPKFVLHRSHGEVRQAAHGRGTFSGSAFAFGRGVAVACVARSAAMLADQRASLRILPLAVHPIDPVTNDCQVNPVRQA